MQSGIGGVTRLLPLNIKATFSYRLHGYFPFDSSDPAADWRAARVLDAQHRDESTVSTIARFYEVTPDSTGSCAATPAGPQLSPAAAALLDGCLSFDPARRPSLDQIIQSCWLGAHCGPCAACAGPGAVRALTAQPLQTPPGHQTPPETPPGLAPLRTPPRQTPPGLALPSGRSPGGAAEATEVAEVREVRLAPRSVEAAMPVPRPVRQEAQTSASQASNQNRSSATSHATTSSGHSRTGHSRTSSAGSAAAITGAAFGLQQIGLPLAAFAVAGAKQLQDTRLTADTAGPKAAQRM